MSFSLKSIYASLPRTSRGVPMVLGADPKGKNILYVNGNSVIIRDLQNPGLADVYTQHSTLTTCAKYSPSGFYIASGDQYGKLRIWDTTNKEHILKTEYQPLGGAIKDISWSPDNQRMVVAGEGRDSYGRVFLVETGSSVGEIIGHSKPINSVDYRQARPFRIVTASEDNQVNFYEGPPFKFSLSEQDHTRFVNAVRFSPDGTHFATGGADGKCFLYDGKTGTLKHEIGTPTAHSGGIYGVAWSPDSKELLTVSGDKTAKVWQVESNMLMQQYSFGTAVEDMQVGCLWQGNVMISVSLSGYLNYLDRNVPGAPNFIVKGHNKTITSLAISEDRSTIFSGSQDGVVMCWDASGGGVAPLDGKPHSNQIMKMAADGDDVLTCSMDDTVRFNSISAKRWSTYEVKLESMPKGLTSKKGLTVVACTKEIVIMHGGRITAVYPVNYEPTSVSYNDTEADVAVGGSADNMVHIYALGVGDALTAKNDLAHGGAITDVAYSPGKAFLGACDQNRRVIVYSVPGYQKLHNVDWSSHSAKVNCIAWSPNSLYLASGGVDTNVLIWNVRSPQKSIDIRNAHPMSPITGLVWLNDNQVVSAGQDCNIRTWDIVHF